MSIEKLLQLEEGGEYVFHGSPHGDIETLEPKQGQHVPDWSKPSEIILDGDPAVSATPYSEFAIFRSLINKKNIPISHTSGFGITNGKTEFRISSEEIFNYIKNKKGYVYVFNKKEFQPYNRDQTPTPNSMEWRSYNIVKPVEIVEVTSDDLPSRDRIRIIE